VRRYNRLHKANGNALGRGGEDFHFLGLEVDLEEALHEVTDQKVVVLIKNDESRARANVDRLLKGKMSEKVRSQKGVRRGRSFAFTVPFSRSISMMLSSEEP